MLSPGAAESIARYAPLGDMALAFDGVATSATAELPVGLLPSDAEGDALDAVSLTLWINVALPPGDGPGVAADFGTRSVAEIYAPEAGVLAALTLAPAAGETPALELSWRLAGTVVSVSLPVAEYAGRWAFVAAVHAPTIPAGTDEQGHATFGTLALTVTNGAPVPVHQEARLSGAIVARDQPRRLTLGGTADPGVTGAAPFHGAITRVRLWREPLTAAQAIGGMYDYPIGPRAYRGGTALVADWRAGEGYGTTAFDYAGVTSTVDLRYRPPGGNHLRLGDGEPGTAPGWVIADIATLVSKTSPAPVSAAGAG